MPEMDFIFALRLLRRFGDSPEVVSLIDKALSELERLYKIEAEWLALKEQPAPDADWTAANRMVER